MTEPKLKLELGHYYVARNGTIVGPLIAHTSQDYPFCEENRYTYRADGRYDDTPSSQDLVRELTPETAQAVREVLKGLIETGRFSTVNARICYPKESLEGPAEHRVIVLDDLGDNPDQLLEESYQDLDRALEGCRKHVAFNHRAHQVYRLVATATRETVQVPEQRMVVRVPGGKTLLNQSLKDVL